MDSVIIGVFVFIFSVVAIFAIRKVNKESREEKKMLAQLMIERAEIDVDVDDLYSDLGKSAPQECSFGDIIDTPYAWCIAILLAVFAASVHATVTCFSGEAIVLAFCSGVFLFAFANPRAYVTDEEAGDLPGDCL